VSDCDEVTGTQGGESTTQGAVVGPTLGVLRQQLRECLDDLQSVAHLSSGYVLVIGASSSEIVGRRIGTQTSLEVGQAVVDEVLDFQRHVGCDVAFQCCEHLNRALVVTLASAQRHGWSRVTAVPVPGAGGAVAAHAFVTLPDACLVETIAADAGMDVGDTFIGMHLKRVAVPVRGRRNAVLAAHVTMAHTRPPLVGGSRAVYDEDEARRRLGLPGRLG
jgi:uncharacterized protein (TIGR01440 family)